MRIIQVGVYEEQWKKIKAFVEKYSHGRSVSSYLRMLILTEIQRIEQAETDYEQQQEQIGEAINDYWRRI